MSELWEKASKGFKRSVYFLFILGGFALFAPMLANEKAILLIQDDDWSSPLFSLESMPAFNEDDIAIFPLIPYGESTLDYEHGTYFSPLDKQHHKTWHERHWFGTDGLGRDVLAQLLYGARTALFVSFGALSLAFLLAIIIGGFSAFLGDYSLQYSKLRIFIMSTLSILNIYMICFIPPYDINAASRFEVISATFFCLFLAIFSFWVAHKLLKSWEKSKRITKYSFALDLYLNRFIEIVDAIPLLFLLLALSAIFPRDLSTLVLVIGISSWTGMAKMFRAEILKAKELAYVESAKALGFTKTRILFKHILPNVLSPLLVQLSFGISAVILIEASFSFLGLGLSAEEASWGNLIAEARNNFKAWWVAILPGLAIFLTLSTCNKIGDEFEKSNRKQL